MQLSYEAARVSVVFDEADLVSCARLVPVPALAGRASLADLVFDTVTFADRRRPGGVNAPVALAAQPLPREPAQWRQLR